MTDIIFLEIENSCNNKLGKIILNRPNALNALSSDMFIALEEKLSVWEKDPAIKAVLIRSSNPKAFCAGGDIRAVYDNHAGDAYFRREYNINRQIFHYQKPYIVLMNGITMGGGVGISLYASHRIASTDLRFAMPETLIGFFPDVGASYPLSRLQNSVGLYLALTGNVIHAQDALQLGLIDAMVSADQFDAIETTILESIENMDGISAAIKPFQLLQNGKTLLIDNIAKCFSFDSIEKIMEALKMENSEWSNAVLSQLLMRSPTSLKVTMQQFQLAKTKTFDEVIEMDFQIAKAMLKQHDFYEGIRAAIIDKDKNPKWCPRELGDVTDEMVKKYF